jgi:hypothetical protein
MACNNVSVFIRETIEDLGNGYKLLFFQELLADFQLWESEPIFLQDFRENGGWKPTESDLQWGFTECLDKRLANVFIS